LKEGIQLLVFTTPVSLHGDDFRIKKGTQQYFETHESVEKLRFVTQEINPSKFTVIIDETHII
jgi:hypothetical protein